MSKRQQIVDKISGSIPLIYGSLLLVILVVLGYFKQSSWNGITWWLNWGVLVIYLLWIFSEMNITVGEVAKGSSQEDRGTCEVYAICRGVCILSALGFGTQWEIPGLSILVGLILFIGGISFRLYAMRTLGIFYSHRVRIKSEHQVIDRGPYSVVRHPAYTGMLLAHCGIVVLFFNWYCLVALLGLLLPAIIQRIKVEELHLFQLPRYSDYAEYRRRLIPFIW
ncbi:MAG: isoprenylcysteine carboxylmethyltransferase family protein [Cyanosarcina radialis HA8281-LM2]|jgi:protein-S-isoprenylcysteine O-methyltransferase Ste14|nr:isoprenylcysteine carboxylmethyltransferase family protein [Cyanosarcina radialis HA8281-LM2]